MSSGPESVKVLSMSLSAISIITVPTLMPPIMAFRVSLSMPST